MTSSVTGTIIRSSDVREC